LPLRTSRHCRCLVIFFSEIRVLLLILRAWCDEVRTLLNTPQRL
jgi:hypothetical protein